MKEYVTKKSKHDRIFRMDLEVKRLVLSKGFILECIKEIITEQAALF